MILWPAIQTRNDELKWQENVIFYTENRGKGEIIGKIYIFLFLWHFLLIRKRSSCVPYGSPQFSHDAPRMYSVVISSDEHSLNPCRKSPFTLSRSKTRCFVPPLNKHFTFSFRFKVLHFQGFLAKKVSYQVMEIVAKNITAHSRCTGIDVE